MSVSTRSYSKESRYSRSASYHNGVQNSSYSRHQTSQADRPLSTRLIERDSSCPSLAWNWDWNDPFFSDRFRWRLGNDFFKWNFGIGRSIPIYYRSWNNSSTSRVIPVQYTPSSPTNRRHRSMKKLDDDASTNFIKGPNESSISRENRLSFNDWPPLLQEPSTRKRTSMTIFPRRPYIDQCDVPYYRQTLPTPTYPQSVRLDYY